MSTPKTYRDKWKCPKGHQGMTDRRTSSAGKIASTWCWQCDKAFKVLAGPVPAPKGKTK